jgi:hypothetical protein
MEKVSEAVLRHCDTFHLGPIWNSFQFQVDLFERVFEQRDQLQEKLRELQDELQSQRELLQAVEANLRVEKCRKKED